MLVVVIGILEVMSNVSNISLRDRTIDVVDIINSCRCVVSIRVSVHDVVIALVEQESNVIWRGVVNMSMNLIDGYPWMAY